MRITCITTALILCCLKAAGQDSSFTSGESRKEFYVYDYVEDLSSEINITPLIFRTRSTFTIRGNEGIDYSPNDGYNVGIRLQHKWLGIAFSYSPQKLQEEKKGNSAFTNLVLNSYGKKMGFDLYYQDYKGYYIQNYKSFPQLDSVTRDGFFPQRSDLQTTSMGFNVYYIFNHKKFSYRSAFANNDWQKKSAGSFTLSTSFNYYHIRGDSSILLTTVDRRADERIKLKDGEFYSVGLMPGYAFTLVIRKHLYFNLSPAVGGILQVQHYLTEHNEIIDRTVVLPRFMARLGMGYAGRKFYAGIASIGDSYNIPLGKNLSLSYTIGSVTFYTGLRIGVPTPLRTASAFLDKCNPGNIFLLFNRH